MADIRLPALPRTGVARAIRRLIGQWRAHSKRARTIDPGALSDYLQRDLGFRDGRSRPTLMSRAAVDRSA
jgi:hypothetical protein